MGQKRFRCTILFMFSNILNLVLSSAVNETRFLATFGTDTRATGTSLRTIQDWSKIRCGLVCMSDSLCGGFNYLSQPNKISECELIRSWTDPEEIQTQLNSMYYKNAKVNHPRDCDEYYTGYGYQTSGTYWIDMLYDGSIYPRQVYCDMDTDGGKWTVVISRLDGSVDFDRGWADYKNGFGNISGEYYLGNDDLHMLTAGRISEVRVDMEKFDGTPAYAVYNGFNVDDETQKYTLHLGNYTAGDAGDSLYLHDGMAFSSLERDNDIKAEYNCALKYHGGFWYRGCSYVRLTARWGETLASETENTTSGLATYSQGIVWATWTGFGTHPKIAVMKIRPTA